MTTLTKEQIAQLKKVKKEMVIPRSNILSEGALLEIISQLETELGLKEFQVKTVLAMLFHQGGTARSCDGNMFVRYEGKEIKLATVRKALKTAGYTRGERKLARSLRDDKFAISSQL